MKANELRIGNYVRPFTNDGYELEIRPIKASEFLMLENNPKDAKPIDLSEEWLLKFGFENSKTQDKFYIKNNSMGISTADNKFRFIQGNFVCQLVLRELMYVHELQNLYFALTGKELLIQPLPDKND